MSTYCRSWGTFCLALISSAAYADVVLSLNTGIGPGGSQISAGSIDADYSLISSADPTLTGTTLYVLSPAGGAGSFPFGFWVPDSSVSHWLVPYANGVVSFATASAAGSYTIRTTFSLAGFNPITASIAGRWAVDETGVNILLNGVATGNSTPAQGYGSFSNIGIASGFVSGLNTVDFVFTNIVQATGNPIGLRVEAIVQATPVPEPSTAVISASGLLVLAFRLTHSRSAA